MKRRGVITRFFINTAELDALSLPLWRRADARSESES